MQRLKAGSKAPSGSVVSLCRGVLDERQTIEQFEADDNRGWTCPETTNGYWYGFETLKLGLIAEKDTGRKVTRAGTEHRLTHQLHRAKHGWWVSLDVCSGAADENRDFPSENAARNAFDALPGELI